jgi:hypothetical protein
MKINDYTRIPDAPANSNPNHKNSSNDSLT